MEMVVLAKSFLKIDLTNLSNVLCQTFVLLLFLNRIVSDVNCIVNNGNILTDGRWNVIISHKIEFVGQNKKTN